MKSIGLSLVVAVGLVLSFASCSNKPKYADMVPANSVVILRVDVKTLAEQSSEGGDLLTKKLKESFGKEEMSLETREKIMKIIDDPAEAGIDLRDPVLLCLTDDKNLNGSALLATLHDADKFEELVNALSKEAGTGSVKAKDDFKYLVVNDAIFAFNDDVFCLTNAQGGEEATVAQAAKILSGQNGSDNKFVTELLDCDGALSMLATGGIYNLSEEYRGLMAKALPEGVDAKDLAVLADLKMERGEIAIDYKMLANSDACQKYIDKMDELYGKIDGDEAKYVSKDGLAFFANANGPELLKQLEGNKAIAEAEAEVKQMIDKIYGCLNGDFTLGVNGFDKEAGMPGIAAYAKTKDSSLSDIITPMASMVKGQAGYKDGTTYATIGSGMEPFKEAANAFKSGDVSDKRAYLYFNFDLLRVFAEANGGSDGKAMFVAAALCDVLEMDYKGDGKGQVRLTFRDKAKYPVEAIVELLQKNI